MFDEAYECFLESDDEEPCVINGIECTRRKPHFEFNASITIVKLMYAIALEVAYKLKLYGFQAIFGYRHKYEFDESHRNLVILRISLELKCVEIYYNGNCLLSVSVFVDTDEYFDSACRFILRAHRYRYTMRQMAKQLSWFYDGLKLEYQAPDSNGYLCNALYGSDKQTYNIVPGIFKLDDKSKIMLDKSRLKYEPDDIYSIIPQLRDMIE